MRSSMFGTRRRAFRRDRALSLSLESMEGRELLSGLAHLAGNSAGPISAVSDSRAAAEATPSLERQVTAAGHVKVQARVSFGFAHLARTQKALTHHRASTPGSQFGAIPAATTGGPPPLSQAWINYLILLGKEDPPLAYNNIVTDVRNDVITAGDGEEILMGINPGWFRTAPLPTVDVPTSGTYSHGNGQGYPAGGIQSVAGFLPFQDVTVTGTPLPGTPYFSAFTVTGHNAANTASGSFSYSTERYGMDTRTTSV